MKKIVTFGWFRGMVLLTALFMTEILFAQKIDQERMDRDLKVSANVLSNLLRESAGTMRGTDIKGVYTEGYGVVFTVPTWGFTYRIRTTKEEGEKAGTISLAPAVSGTARKSGDTDPYKAAFIDFLVDYADLIGQLQPTDRILIKTRQNDDVYVISEAISVGQMSSRSQNNNISAEILKSDIISYKQGKTSREATVAKVNVKELKPADVERDITVFSGILEALFDTRTTRNYFISGRTYIERIPDMGATLNMNFYSSYPSVTEKGLRVHSLPTLGLDNIPQEERDKRVTEMYPQFEEDMKKYIAEYGRTVTSLKDNEVLTVTATLTTCEGCGIPKAVSFSIKGSLLKEYSAGRLTMEKVLAEIKVKKEGVQ